MHKSVFTDLCSSQSALIFFYQFMLICGVCFKTIPLHPTFDAELKTQIAEKF